MANNNFSVTIGEKDYTNNVVYPIKWSKQLDERLDETRISVKRIKSNIIHPLTPATITLTDKKGKNLTIDAVVTTDESAEVPVGAKTYDHEIMMLEETKILEGIVVDALTFTNDLGRRYADLSQLIPVDTSFYRGQGAIMVDKLPNETEINDIKESRMPKAVGTNFTFISFNKMFNVDTSHLGYVANWLVQIKHDDEVLKVKGQGYDKPYPSPSPAQLDPNDLTVTLEEGTYTAIYEVGLMPSATSDYPKPTNATRVEYSFVVVKNKEPLPRWNIATVIDRVLDLAEPHLQGVAPRFKLNDEQHAEFAKIESPEFAFTNSTLKEVLDQIGGYIHGIPRLRGNTIYFDMLGGTEQARLADPKYVNTYVSQLFSQDIESYCTGLDSTVDNCVSTLDTETGTVTEPYDDGYQTVRTETVYARVEAGNMFIYTQQPIHEIIKVKCGLLPNQIIEGGDITPYVFEEAEYSRLSSYSSTYSNSKLFAIYYTQGTKNIYGLNFKVPNAASGVFEKYAIINILETASHTSIDVKNFPYEALAFQVTYKPIFNARIQQTKQYIGEYKQPRTLVYNQGANLVETPYFGENVKGAVARMGNVDRIVTYNLGDFSLIPEIGQMYGDDYYISGVTCEIYPTLLKCMLTLSQDFNRLSQYIGINSVKRFYEVSEKQAYARNIKYADYVVIGDTFTRDETIAKIEPIQNIFTQAEDTKRISHVIAQAISEGKNVGELISLPVVCAAFGTAMSFTFRYEDNYSAGAQVSYETAGDVSGYFTNGVEYADPYGRFDSLAFAMRTYETPSKPESLQRSLGMMLPEWSGSLDTNPIIGTRTNPLVVQKDGAEILSVNYILEFVTNKKNYIIGSAMARNSPLVRGVSRNRYASLYILPKRIGKFDNTITNMPGTKVWDYGPIPQHITVDTKSIKFENFTPAINGEAWAIVDNSTGEILLASNETITAGTPVQMPYMTLRHNIFNIGG